VDIVGNQGKEVAAHDGMRIGAADKTWTGGDRRASAIVEVTVAYAVQGDGLAEALSTVEQPRGELSIADRTAVDVVVGSPQPDVVGHLMGVRIIGR